MFATHLRQTRRARGENTITIGAQMIMRKVDAAGGRPCWQCYFRGTSCMRPRDGFEDLVNQPVANAPLEILRCPSNPLPERSRCGCPATIARRSLGGVSSFRDELPPTTMITRAV